MTSVFYFDERLENLSLKNPFLLITTKVNYAMLR